MSTITPQFFIRTLVITFTLLTGSQAFAASACKGQTDTVCNQNDSCYWVTGYKRSDGANVKGHCRAKPQTSIKESTEVKTTKESKQNTTSDSKTAIKKASAQTAKDTATRS